MSDRLRVALEAFDEGRLQQAELRSLAGREEGRTEAERERDAHGWREFLGALLAGDPPIDTQVHSDSAPDGGPYCSTCRGARWLRYDERPGHPQFGQVARCTDCLDHLLVRRRNQLAAWSELSDEQRSRTFATLRHVSGVEAAIAACAAFAEKPGGWLVLYGAPGSGKTHLGLAVTNALIHRLEPVRWAYAPDVTLQGRRLMARDEGGYFEFLQELRDAPVLVLDDLTAAKATEWSVQELFEPLFDARYRHRRPTLVTLIGSPAQVKEHISPSIGRRMEDPAICTVVRNAAPQYVPPLAA